MSKIPITAAGLALAAGLTLAGCSSGPAAQESGAAPVTANMSMVPVLPDLTDLSKQVDVAAAQAALSAGAPFAFSIPDGPEAACHSAVVDPDGKVWILNRSGAAPSTGIALSTKFKEYGCTSLRGGGTARTETPDGIGMDIPPAADGPTVPDLSWLSTAVWRGSAQVAMRTEKPFMFGAPDGGVAACHTGLLLPGGDVWVMNKIGAAPAAGVALDRTMKTYGCRDGAPNGEGN
ncbi:Uncharacterised protein [Mycobacteroides abscessus subsp. abscessus]|uniref:hypothetical protein n=1 Tax=Mycobacteroides abscessus TaxID=36809 RepID=UPI0009A7A664|nr:hypothetical protein [Mycobacteroides abscessus]SKM35310.1 Uncharacterised protein [Mycobacteroides abscessus subsp. abscessus]